MRVNWDISGGVTTKNVKYPHADELGSIDRVTDQGGAVTAFRSDPFGSRVDPANPTQSASNPLAAVRRGFTGHEHDDELGLVNMVGRMYDPKTGSFLTPDPIVSNPFNGQAYNRYSYVLNNPTTLVDPSGFTPGEAANGAAYSAAMGEATRSGGMPPGTNPNADRLACK
jgi:RHS repeat-associated protein